MRILVSAASISPYRGSEPGVGWSIVSRLAREHETHVLTASMARGKPNWYFRKDLERYFQENPPIPNLHIHWVDRPLLCRLLQVGGGQLRKLFYYQGYAAWQRACYRYAQALCESLHFDLAHHLNITTFREPGFLWKLPVPFVWGPIAGAPVIPGPFLPMMSENGRIFHRLRNAVTRRHMLWHGRSRAAAQKARRVFTATPEDYRMVTELWGCEAEFMNETGTTVIPGRTPRRRQPGEPLELVWSGRVDGAKALPLVLHALAGLREQNVHLTVLGTGPEAASSQKLAERLGVAERVSWTGGLPRSEAVELMDKAHVLVFSSLKEATSTVVLEALSLGLPVICHDTCGMSVAVTAECGIKIPMTDPRSSIEGFSAAIRRFLDEPGLLEGLSEGALRRAGELTWDKKVDRMSAVYESIVSNGTRQSAARKETPR